MIHFFFCSRLGLCPGCMKKLFYHSNKRKKEDGESEQHESQSKRKRSSKEKSAKKVSKHDNSSPASAASEELAGSSGDASSRGLNDLEQKIWTKSTNEEEQTREQEINKYLQDLLM